MLPADVIRRAAFAGVRTLGIADHESIGAFLIGNGAIWKLAGQFAVSLVPSIEVDAEYEGHEVHILGSGLNLSSTPLLAHCAEVQRVRHARTAEELEQVNRVLGRQALDPESVFAAPRQTFMRPNLIHPLLDQGVFPSYEDAAAWFREHIQPTTQLSRPTIRTTADMIHWSGARAILAHPGYGVREGWLDLERDLPRFAAQGIQAVEADYPYAVCSPHLFTADEEAALVARITDAAIAAGLKTTAGSDSHRASEFDTRWAIARS